LTSLEEYRIKFGMVDTVYLYVSAAADLEPERDLLSRAMVEIPVPLAWRIVQTPLHGEPLDLEIITRANVHLLLIGSDIRAPIGQEWWVARHARHLPVLFIKKDVARTPAAQAFIRHLSEYTGWRPYKNSPDLHRQIILYMSAYFQEHAQYYALTPAEIERLLAWRTEQEHLTHANIKDTRGDAADSSVVFSSERYTPSDGMLLKGKPTHSSPPDEPS